MPVDVWAIDGLTLSGLETRLVEALAVMPDGTALGSRSGVRPGDPGLTVTLAGSTINTSAGVAVVAYASQGVYKAAFPSSTSPGALTAAHATLDRIDLVYLRVWDNSVDASGLNKADIVYLAGTPAASPVAPTPAGTQIYMPLATITVPHTGAGSPSVSTSVRPFTVAPGGILPSTATPTGLYVGQYWDDGTNLRRWNGSTWDTYVKAPGASTAWTPTWSTSTGSHLPSYGNATIDCRYFKLGRLVMFSMSIVFGSTTNFGSGATSGDNWTFTLPVTALASTSYPVGKASFEPGATKGVGGIAQTTSDGTGILLYVDSAAANLAGISSGIVDSVSPWAWVSGNKLTVTGQYEATS
jgi:hypothetical protein